MQAQKLLYPDDISSLSEGAIDLLKELIKIPSFSKEENKTAHLLESFFKWKNIPCERYLNNVWATNLFYDSSKPTLLLNSHHDTVKPCSGYTKNPFEALVESGKLFGLGSNDAGGALTSLIACFLHFYNKDDLKYNLVMLASAEEEISGSNGVSAVIPLLGTIDCAIVGEPTEMQMAIAERGLLVLDAVARGKSGHAARAEGDNAIYKAVKDIEWIKQHRFSKTSDLLGEVKMSVTVIETENKAHNVVPDLCRFVIDVRVNELYSFEEVLEEIGNNISSEIQPRSLRMKPSLIKNDHPLVKAGMKCNRNIFGSSTISDKSLMPFPALKIGPGHSSRSHSADEFICLEEIRNGIKIYIDILNHLL